MKTAVATGFRCSRPLTDLTQLTLMFATFILQYLNKLVEGNQVGDFAPPKPFHTVKVQCFNGNCIKGIAKIRRKLPMKIFALVCNLPIEASYCSDSTPPTARPFLFAAQCLVEITKFGQGLFQRLWVLSFLTRAKCQVRVFHTEVCPNALTCCRKPRFGIREIRCEIEPIVTAGITFYCDSFYITFPLAVLEKGVEDSIKCPLARIRIPFTQREGDTVIRYLPPRLPAKCDRSKLMPLFDVRSAAESIEKALIGSVNTLKFLLNCLTWQSIPMRVSASLQLCQVRAHRIIVRIRQPVFIPLTLPLMEVFMHLPHIIKQVANPNTIGLMTKRILIGFHGISSIKPLTPNEWVGRHVTLRLRSLCLPT